MEGQPEVGVLAHMQIILMDLITGTPDADALTDLLRTAYGQL